MEASPPNDENFDDLKKSLDSGELTQESLQEKLKLWHAAYEQEFLEAQTKATEPADVAANTRQFFRNNAAASAAQIAHLAQFAYSEGVRASCSKYIVDKVMEDAEHEDNPIRSLMESLRKNDSKPQPAHSQPTNSHGE